MAQACDTIKRLPLNPQNGDEVCDKFGNKFIYDAESDAWISKGLVKTPNIVSEDANGIITSETYNKLRHLDNLITNNLIDFSQFKIEPGTNGYWYYLRSSDKLFRFTAEAEDKLRIEVDTGRIFQILAKNSCKGPRGATGDRGAAGGVGAPGPPEPFFAGAVGSTEPDKLDFAIFTPTLEDTDVVIRIYDCGSETYFLNNCGSGLSSVATISTTKQISYWEKIIKKYGVDDDTKIQFQNLKQYSENRSLGIVDSEVACDNALNDVRNITVTSFALDPDPIVTITLNLESGEFLVVSDEEYAVSDKTTIKYDEKIGAVCGSVYLETEWDTNNYYCIQSRQKGLTGPVGDQGFCGPKITTKIVDDTNVFGICPIVNVRHEKEKDALYTICGDVIEKCADKLQFPADSGGLSDQNALDSTFAAAQTTLEECKLVNSYKLAIKDDDIPDLSFSHWDPQPGCQTARHYDRHKFNWMSGLTGPECGEIPKILQAPKPEEQCCTEDFFYCPNIQDPPCGVTIDFPTTTTTTTSTTSTTTTSTTTTSPTPVAAARANTIHDTIKIREIPTDAAFGLGTRKWKMRT